MFLSIIIPIYNVAAYIDRCLNSILNQKKNDLKIEIILINDGSKDNSLPIINQYAATYPEIIVINQDNKGAGSARNAGLSVAKGSHIWFIDSDDFIEAGAFEFIEAKLLQLGTKASFAFNYFKYYNDTKAQINAFDAENDNERIYNGLDYTFDNKPFYLWNVIYSLDIIKQYKIRFIEGIKNIEDFEFNLKYFDKVNQFTYFNTRFYNYCDNQNSTSRNKSLENLIKLADDSYVVHKAIRTNIKDNNYLHNKEMSRWLHYSVSGFIFSLISIGYPKKEILSFYNLYSSEKLIPIQNFTFFNSKMKFFNKVINNNFIFKLLLVIKRIK